MSNRNSVLLGSARTVLKMGIKRPVPILVLKKPQCFKVVRVVVVSIETTVTDPGGPHLGGGGGGHPRHPRGGGCWYSAGCGC